MKATELRYAKHQRRTLLQGQLEESDQTLRAVVGDDVLVLDEGTTANVGGATRSGYPRALAASTSWCAGWVARVAAANSRIFSRPTW